jgi:hypothetical protein
MRARVAGQGPRLSLPAVPLPAARFSGNTSSTWRIRATLSVIHLARLLRRSAPLHLPAAGPGLPRSTPPRMPWAKQPCTFCRSPTFDEPLGRACALVVRAWSTTNFSIGAFPSSTALERYPIRWNTIQIHRDLHIRIYDVFRRVARYRRCKIALLPGLAAPSRRWGSAPLPSTSPSMPEAMQSCTILDGRRSGPLGGSAPHKLADGGAGCFNRPVNEPMLDLADEARPLVDEAGVEL